MKFTRNVKAISKLLLILLLLGATIIGGILSYLWAIAPFINLRIPEKSALAITNAAFNPQNTSYFEVTILNPSYSPTEANITEIFTSTEDDIMHNVTEVHPLLPYRLSKGEEETFKCVWDWANYTDETIRIIAFVAGGSGPTFEAVTPLVDLEITDVRFDSSISVTHFNMTVQNRLESVTYVNITGITVDEEDITPLVSPALPSLHPNDSVPFICSWDWTDYQDKNVTITVKTSQGYVAYYPEPPERITLPSRVVLTITGALFEVTNTTRFNVTVQYSEGFPQYVNITRITATLEEQIIQEWTMENGTEVNPQIPYTLDKNSSETFACPWNWTRYWGKNVTITVYTLQNFTKQYATATPSPINITDVIFDPTSTNQFNVIVNNSEFYFANVNITDITLTVGNETFPINGTEVQPFSLPYPLSSNSNITFVCPWNWTDYQGKSVTVIVRSVENYATHFTKVTSKRVILAITSVLFDPIDTTGFNITVRNSNSSLEDAYISKVTVTLENETIKEIPFSYTLSPNSTVTIPCLWDWTNYRGKNITITVHATKGYETSTLYTTPPES